MKYLWMVWIVAVLMGIVTYAVADTDIGKVLCGDTPCIVYDDTLSSLGIAVLHDGKRNGDVAQCLEKMEAVMRAKEALDAHDERLHPKSNIVFIDGSASIDWGWHGMNDLEVITIPDTRTEEQRLDDEERGIKNRRAELAERRKRDAERKRLTEENAAMHKAFTEQWAAVKQGCWAQP